MDGRIAEVLCHKYIFHLTSLISPHYLVKHKSDKCVYKSVGVSELGSTEIRLIEPGVKVNGAYYCISLLAQKLLQDILWIPQGGWVLCLSARRRIEHTTPSLSWSERR